MKKGFTLVELLAVIVLLGVIMGIAFTAVGSIQKGVKKKMLDEKITMIEEAAELYGDEIRNDILAASRHYYENGASYQCTSVDVKFLVDNKLLTKDDENCTTGKCIINPLDNTYMDNMTVIIYLRNRRIKAILKQDNSINCS